MTKVRYNSFFILLIFILNACSVDYGNKLESDELDIFFKNQKDESLAKEIALYWKNHDLLGNKKQFLQLDHVDGIYQLKLIPTDKFDPKSFTFDERALLKQLQDSLQFIVAPKRLELVIANNNFEPLYNINQ